MRYPCWISDVQHIQPLSDRVCLCWVGCDFLFAKPSQYLASIAEVFIVSRTMYQHIVDIYLAYTRDISGQYSIGHTTLKERARAFESHGNSVPFKQSILSDESRVLLRIRMQRCLMIPCSKIYNAEDLGLKSPYSINNLLDIGNGPSF